MSRFLKELLDVYWLRPETALWRAIDIEVMKDFEVCGKSLDLGCGDGVFSFIRAGGRFDFSFDDYQSMGDLDRFFQGDDVHDFLKLGYLPQIVKKPKYTFSNALDHKRNLLKKAEKLSFYQKLTIHDANERFPFADNSFNTVFSNIIYWLDDPQKSLNEISRVLIEGGRAALMLPNATLPEFSFYNQLYLKTKNADFSFLRYLDRGRFSSNIKASKSYIEWKKLIDNSGLSIVSHQTHLSKRVIQIWDIGLRPLFPVLHKLISSIEDKETLRQIKKEWVDIFYKFLEPIYELEKNREINRNKHNAFHYFVLEK